jgi:hypothetical protein
MSKSSLSRTLFCDRKPETFRVYVSKIEVYTKLVGTRDALDPISMEKCPTLEPVAVHITMPKNQILIDLYKENTNLCAIIVPGQGKSHRMAILRKIKSNDYANRLAWELISKAMKANKPSNASTVIKLEMDLERLLLSSGCVCIWHECLTLLKLVTSGVSNFYNDVVRVMDKYPATKTDCMKCMLMACENQDVAHAELVLKELKLSSLDSDRLCNDVSKIQRLTISRNKGKGMVVRRIFISLL